MGLTPEWVVKNGVFAIQINESEHYINFERSPLNSHLSVSLSGNKHLTRLILKRRGHANIPFKRVRTLTAATAFLDEHGVIIAKPLKGSGSRGIKIISSTSDFDGLVLSNHILEKYMPGVEMRYLIMDGRVIAVHRSNYGTSVDKNRDLERMSLPHTDWDQAIAARSITIAELLGLRFAAVDYLVDNAGAYHLLEVGAAPGFKWFHAPSSGPAVDVAHMFLSAYIDKVHTQGVNA